MYLKNYRKQLFVLIFLFVAIGLMVACAPAQPGPNNPNSILELNPEIRVIQPDLYIAVSGDEPNFAVSTFINKFGRECTVVMSLYAEAATSISCDKAMP